MDMWGGGVVGQGRLLLASLLFLLLTATWSLAAPRKGRVPNALARDASLCLSSLKGRKNSQQASLKKRCPKKPPPHLKGDFTLNATIPLSEHYLCHPPGRHREYTTELVLQSTQRIEAGKSWYYKETDHFLRRSLNKTNVVMNRSVVVLGSQIPWYETMAHYFGAQKVTTIEYQTVKNRIPWLHTRTVQSFWRRPSQFDVALSISSFEHDGLGRYGDPLNPYGDIQAMEELKCIVKPMGYLFLAVPVGKDQLAWNTQRVYGPIRLPLLLKKWKLLAVVGGKNFGDYYGKNEAVFSTQPVFYLSNEGGMEADFTSHNNKVLQAEAALTAGGGRPTTSL